MCETRVLKRLDKERPLSSSEVSDKIQVLGGWGDTATFGRIALEILWKMGRVVVVKRENGKKYYDLPHKISLSLQGTTLNKELTKEHILRRLRSVGLLPISGSGGGWQGLEPVKEVAAIIRDLITTNVLCEIRVDDVKRSYVSMQEDREILLHSRKTGNKKVVFIAPLDNILWDRHMVSELFDFHYRWEVYTPVKKRKFGYYVLPILYGETFIGRIEPVLTKEKNLEVKGFWQEDKSFWTPKVWNAFSEALEQFKTYLHASNSINAYRVNM